MQYKGIKIVKRKDCKKGSWVARFQRNNIPYRVAAGTQKKCYIELKELVDNLDNRVSKTGFTLLEWKTKWLNLYKINKLRESTLKDYEYLDKHIPDKLLKRKISSINSIELLEVINNVTGSRQRQKLYEYLKDIFTKAFKNLLIKHDLFLNIEKPKHESKETSAMTIEEEHKFIETCKNSKLGDMFLLALFQGLRRGEVMALKRNDIDLENLKLRIDESFNDKSSTNETKNKSSNRVMPIFKNSIPILEKYISGSPEERLFEISSKPVQLAFKEILKNAGIRDFKIHELRHTFITRCKEENIPEHIVQSWVGHTIGSKVTSAVYTHVNDEISLQNVEKLNSTWTTSGQHF